MVARSGSAKSPTAAAGLVGRLRKGALPGSESWHVVPPMVPGDHPRETLAMRPADRAAGSAVVVVVDQFEELFALCASETERAAFVAELLALATRASPAHRVVLTVRTDFEGLVAR